MSSLEKALCEERLEFLDREYARIKQERREPASRTLKDVRDAIEMEGFDYAFRSYSEFPEVDDPMFHHLRRAYIHAADELEDYLPESDEAEGDDSNNTDERED